MRGKGSTATGAVRNNLKALIKEALVPNLLKSPPLGLDKVVCIGYVGVVHISPEADSAREVLPHFLVVPYGFLAVSDKGLKSVCLNLVLAVDSKLFLNLKLNRKTVGVPACLTKHASAFHCVVSRNHILDNTGKNVAYVRLAVCCGGAVIECVVFASLADINAFFENFVCFPELSGSLFALNKI